MITARELLMHAYYAASWPVRTIINRRDALRGKAPISVLFYHRVADSAPNPWTCTNAQFAQQMRWLKQHFDMITIGEAQQRLRNGLSNRPAVCVTFDDGYAENCEQAIPLLVREAIPCTYFVATRYVFDQLPFPHDLARSQRLQPNTLNQLRDMAKAGIEIGAHTRNHVDLGQIHDPHRLEDEVVLAGEELQAAVGKPVRYFAFPFGQHPNLNAEVFHLAHAAGYEAVCSAYGGYNVPGDDAFHLQRVHGDPEFIRVKNSTTIDPRKRFTKRYDYETAQHEPAETRSEATAKDEHAV
ncbi:MAG: polysaccharide deacetylase family protein [Planctomycetaceae bacterium]|nr:polysaccharide deacetylase family protein [Planctomycetaceae bacterium]